MRKRDLKVTGSTPEVIEMYIMKVNHQTTFIFCKRVSKVDYMN